jgi:YVTN family beta-propeller protein
MRRAWTILLIAPLLWFVAWLAAFNGADRLAVPSVAVEPTRGAKQALPDIDRSPVALALTPDEKWLVTANQTSGTVSLVDVQAGTVAAEAACGKRPAGIAVTPDGRQVLVTAMESGELTIFSLDEDKPNLKLSGQVRLGFEPRGVAVSPDGRRAYVALTAANSVAVVDLKERKEIKRIAVDRWPRYLSLSRDGAKLAVGCSGSSSITVIDVAKGEVAFSQSFESINIGHLHVSADGQRVYAPSMVYRQNPVNPRTIRLGWVLASRIGYIGLDKPARRFAIALDVPGKAMSDPYGIGLTADEQWMACTSSGTHELLVYKVDRMPFGDTPGPGDLVDRQLAADRKAFYRVELGGRPMGLTVSRDGRVFVANYLLNCVQVVDLASRSIATTIPLGGPPEPSLARRGEAIFYDARHSLDQWYSCHSCHYEGGGNSVTMDTRNDGSERTFKTVLPLYNVTRTAPWTWHGWQKDLRAAMVKSFSDTMQGPKPRDEDVTAIIAYLETLKAPASPHRELGDKLSAAALRGQAVFRSEKAGCANCHRGPQFTDGLVHDVGLNSPKDVYKGFNTPSLLAVHNKVRYLHNGRAKSLEEVLTEYHDPAKVTGLGELTADERKDLIEYLKSL